jgi:hypothetical protein
LIVPEKGYDPRHADVAQLVEHFTRNEGVSGSNPLIGFFFPADDWLLA